MFTSIMYGFINEVTRQPGSAEIPLRRPRRAAPVPSTTRRQPNPRAAGAKRPAQLAGRYQVLADSFKRAAGFH
jgi:hypothetical protein